MKRNLFSSVRFFLCLWVIQVFLFMSCYQSFAQFPRFLRKTETKDAKGRTVETNFDYGGKWGKYQIADGAKSVIKETGELLAKSKLINFVPGKGGYIETEEINYDRGRVLFKAIMRRSLYGRLYQSIILNYKTGYKFDESGRIIGCETVDLKSKNLISKSHIIKYEKGIFMVVKETQYDDKGGKRYEGVLKRELATSRIIGIIEESGNKVGDFHHFEYIVDPWPTGD